MVCDVIDECRCYAYDYERDPRQKQICAVRRGRYISPCPPGCCAGGCPGQTEGTEPREPFRIVKRHFKDGENDRMSFADKIRKMNFDRLNRNEIYLVIFVILITSFGLMIYLT